MKILKKHFWLITLLILSVSGITFGLWGFCRQDCNFSDSLYKTFQMFVLNIAAEEAGNWTLQCARWLIVAAFLWATFRLFFEIIAPQFFRDLTVKLWYKDHIVICGLNKITRNLVNKYQKEKKKIVVLAEESNKYAETLRTEGVKVLIGDLSNENLLQKAKIKSASQIFAVIDNDDKENVEIAQNVSRISTNIKCFVLIRDRKLKTILEESTLFKYKTETFDGTLFNINEMGIKYGIAMNIDQILPAKINTPPKILLYGLTEKTEIILLNLAHCLTRKREQFNFVVVEKDNSKISEFKTKYAYLQNFAAIEYTETIPEKQKFDAVLICIENQTAAVEKAVEIRYILGTNEPNIMVFCDDTDSFIGVLEANEKEVFTLKDRNIFIVNLFDQIVNYMLNLEKHIEEQAMQRHDYWKELSIKQIRENLEKENDEQKRRELEEKLQKEENRDYHKESAHFKQTNRNQVLDNDLKTYIARGKKMTDLKEYPISFLDKEKETLARMEHRRWMIEKYENGWVYNEKRNDDFKRHTCLIDWNELSQNDRNKDMIPIDLMLEFLNNQKQ
jgi:hypothetical protein